MTDSPIFLLAGTSSATRRSQHFLASVLIHGMPKLPLKAIIIVSLMFVVVHLHQAWSGPIVFHIFFISVLFGSIAYYSKSLIPGIIAHSIMDICNFSFWWSDLGFQFNERPIKETGFDLHLALWIVILMLSIGFFIQIMKKLNKLS